MFTQLPLNMSKDQLKQPQLSSNQLKDQELLSSNKLNLPRKRKKKDSLNNYSEIEHKEDYNADDIELISTSHYRSIFYMFYFIFAFLYFYFYSHLSIIYKSLDIYNEILTIIINNLFCLYYFYYFSFINI